MVGIDFVVLRTLLSRHSSPNPPLQSQQPPYAEQMWTFYESRSEVWRTVVKVGKYIATAFILADLAHSYWYISALLNERLNEWHLEDRLDDETPALEVLATVSKRCTELGDDFWPASVANSIELAYGRVVLERASFYGEEDDYEYRSRKVAVSCA